MFVLNKGSKYSKKETTRKSTERGWGWPRGAVWQKGLKLGYFTVCFLIISVIPWGYFPSFRQGLHLELKTWVRCQLNNLHGPEELRGEGYSQLSESNLQLNIPVEYKYPQLLHWAAGSGLLAHSVGQCRSAFFSAVLCFMLAVERVL